MTVTFTKITQTTKTYQQNYIILCCMVITCTTHFKTYSVTVCYRGNPFWGTWEMGAKDSWAFSVPISQEWKRSVFRMGMAGVTCMHN